MENIPDKEDEQWLSALAGHTDPSGAAKSNMQAQALRKALQVHAEKLEAMVPFAGEEQYQALVKRLQREQLLPVKSGWRNSPIWVKTTGALGISSDVIPWKSPMVWGGVAAMLVLAVFINTQIQSNKPGDDLRYRGDAKVTTLIVEYPEMRAKELQAGLNKATTSVEINNLPYGRIQIKVQSSQAVLDYLQTQRIQPIVIDGFITIDVVPTKK